MSGKSKFQISRSLDERIKRIISGANDHDSEFAQISSAYILGFNYGNITNCVGLTTNYQLNHAVFPVVGLVFFQSSPTDDDIKSSLKSVREYSSSPNGLGSFKSDKNEHLFLIYSVNSETKEVDKRIFNFTKGTFVRRKRMRLNVLNDPYGARYRKGTEDLFNLGDADSQSSSDDYPVDHLIFFIHGVGGVCDVRFRSCEEVVADFRKMANNLLAQQSIPSSRASTPTNKHLAQHLKKGFFRKLSSDSSASRSSDTNTENKTFNHQSRPRRVECWPVSWHSCTRKQTGVNDQLNLVALNSVPKLRHFLNKVVIDALLYASGPVYSQTIITNVGEEINRLYTIFMEKHPNFNGSVSLAGHSLGSVIVFDLLANQIPSRTTASKSNDDLATSAKSGSSNIDNEIKVEANCRKSCLNVSHHHFDPTTTNLKNCVDYKNLDELLVDMNLKQYIEVFQREHIDINTLLLLTDLDMKELNLPLGARRKLGTYINFKKVATTTIASGMQQPPPSQNNTRQQEQLSSSDIKEEMNNCNNDCLFNIHNSGQYLIKYPQLKFKPRCFFAFGSPMPMFLNVRGMQEMSDEYKLPTCDRMFNIFHPYDPLAYRIEPLIDPRFKNVEPVQIPHHRGGKRIHVQLREGFARVGHDIKHRLLGSIRDTWTSFTRSNVPPAASPTGADSRKLTKSASSSVDVEVESFDSSGNSPFNKQKKQLKRQQSVVQSPSEMNVASLESIIEDSVRQTMYLNSSDFDEDSAMTNHMESSNVNAEDDAQTLDQKQTDKKVLEDLNSKQNSIEVDSTRIGRLNGGRRIDYVLQEKPIELFNEYIFAFTSHANYWQNEDSALILLNEIYQADNIQIFDHFD